MLNALRTRVDWTATAVVNQYRRRASNHIVRVDVRDRQIAHVPATTVGEVTNRDNRRHPTAVSVQRVTRDQISRQYPPARGLIPERVVLRGVQNRLASSGGLHGHVG